MKPKNPTPELKTLEEIAFPRQGGSCYQVEVLRQEAINWIKVEKHIVTQDWIDFFNITEEELAR